MRARVVLTVSALLSLIGVDEVSAQTAHDSVAWRHLLAPAILAELRRSDSLGRYWIAPPPVGNDSAWQRDLVEEVRRSLDSLWGTQRRDPLRSVVITAPAPPGNARPAYRGRVLTFVGLSIGSCTAPPSGGTGGYFGFTYDARVIQRPESTFADVVGTGTFDGFCATTSPDSLHGPGGESHR